MSKSVVVLGVPHQLQGPGFKWYVNDPSYSLLVQNLIQFCDGGADFVFEEASGRRPSTAKDVAESLLGPNHYLDIDPPPDERGRLGIAREVGGGGPIDRSQRVAAGDCWDMNEWSIVGEQSKREKLWQQRIQDQAFERGLAICGVAHNLSLAFRLASVGISVVKSYIYIPFHRLCARQHAG